jgi:hypothetical protein
LVLLFTVTMSPRKSARVLKEVPVNAEASQTSKDNNEGNIDERKQEMKPNTKVLPAVKNPYASQKTTFVITTKPPAVLEPNLDVIYGLYYKVSGDIVPTGSLKEAELVLGQLPEYLTVGCGVIIKQFASAPELQAFRAALANETRVDAGAIPAMRFDGNPKAMEYDVKRANLKRSENLIEVDLDDIPEIKDVTANSPKMESTTSSDDISAEGVLANQSPAAKRMRSVIRTKGMKLIVHYWPGVPGSAIAQIIFIDIIDTRQDFTHWLQRPEKWVDVFGNIDQECENTPNPLGKFFSQMRSAHFRAPTGDNVSQTKIVKGSDSGGKLTLHRQGLYTYLPNGHNSDTIRDHIKRNMARVLNDCDIQVCYRMIMTETSRNTRIPELLAPRQGAGSGGVFWDQLQGAVDGMEFVPHASLKDVFLNNDVINITKSLFQGVTDQMFTSGSLPAEIEAFANGAPL